MQNSKNRKHWPLLPGKMRAGKCYNYQTIYCVKWHDKGGIFLLSTIHREILVDSGKEDRENW